MSAVISGPNDSRMMRANSHIINQTGICENHPLPHLAEFPAVCHSLVIFAEHRTTPLPNRAMGIEDNARR